MQSIIHSLEDDVEYSESDISDVESSEDESINDDESDFTVSTLHSHHTTPIPTSSTTKHGGELSSILDDEQTPLDENIANEFFEETYKEGEPEEEEESEGEEFEVSDIESDHGSKKSGNGSDDDDYFKGFYSTKDKYKDKDEEEDEEESNQNIPRQKVFVKEPNDPQDLRERMGKKKHN